MLHLRSEILEHLVNGGTLLVPSRQRASAVRLAYGAAMLARGLQLWSSPDVLPWTAWVERELDDARARGEPLPQRLTSTEEWLLWQEAVHDACAGFDVLMPDGMTDPVRRAVGLLDDYGIDLVGLPTAEAAVLRQSVLHFRRRCADLAVLGRSSWRDLSCWLRPSARLWIADSGMLGREREQWLVQHGARIAPLAAEPGACEVYDFETTTHEADAAASWCAAQWMADPRARLLVIVPQLRDSRHLWERAFSQRLNPALILAGRDSSAESGFAIEGGRSLTGYRLVCAALQLIGVTAGRADFNDLSAVLRSPYLSAIPSSASLNVDRWLREHSIASARLPLLRSVLRQLGDELGEGTATAVAQWLAVLEAPARIHSATPREWAEVWAGLLQRCGWPGTAALSSDEQQVRMRFDELLGEFASVRVPAHRLSLIEAMSRLQIMATRVSFEPASDDVPVTITARLEDPVVHYDGIWIAGLSSDVWPPAAAPDPLLPLPLQYAAGIRTANAAGQLSLARQLQERWLRSSRQCVLSWSRTSQDLPRDRSPLLPQGLERAQPLQQVVPLEIWSAAHAPVLEAWTDRTRPAPTVDGTLQGGTRLLELQSLCPFRAYAELRLQASPLEPPAPGINPRVRGMILHQALELFWKNMGDQATLKARNATSSDQVRELVDHSVARALQETLQREPGTASEAMKQREHARTARLISEMLKWELGRPWFTTTILESPLRYEFAGAALDLRLDRVDRLEDGLQLVLDYKTGAPKTFDGLAERLRQPQLPAYALAAGSGTAGVAALYLGREGVKLRGSTDRASRVGSRLAPRDAEPVWPERLERWRQQLQILIDEYLRGDASVRPLPDACKLCHLHSLCRIDPATLAALDTDPDNPDGEESEEESEEEGG